MNSFGLPSTVFETRFALRQNERENERKVTNQVVHLHDLSCLQDLSDYIIHSESVDHLDCVS